MIILVLEDNEPLRRALIRSFEREGWRVITAATCADALSLTEAIDLAVLDVELPDGGGIRVGQHLAGRTRYGIVFFTGLGRDEVEQQDVGEVVPKTLGISALVCVVRRKITEGSPVVAK